MRPDIDLLRKAVPHCRVNVTAGPRRPPYVCIWVPPDGDLEAVRRVAPATIDNQPVNIDQVDVETWEQWKRDDEDYAEYKRTGL